MEILGYADPGTGAMVWQLLAAGFVGSLFYAKQAIRWVKEKISKPKDPQ